VVQSYAFIFDKQHYVKVNKKNAPKSVLYYCIE